STNCIDRCLVPPSFSRSGEGTHLQQSNGGGLVRGAFPEGGAQGRQHTRTASRSTCVTDSASVPHHAVGEHRPVLAGEQGADRVFHLHRILFVGPAES